MFGCLVRKCLCTCSGNTCQKFQGCVRKRTPCKPRFNARVASSWELRKLGWFGASLAAVKRINGLNDLLGKSQFVFDDTRHAVSNAMHDFAMLKQSLKTSGTGQQGLGETSSAAEKADFSEAERVWPPSRRQRPQARTDVLEASVESFADATQALQSKTGGAEGQTYSARFAHLRFMKFGAGAGGFDPKLINRLQAESSSGDGEGSRFQCWLHSVNSKRRLPNSLFGIGRSPLPCSGSQYFKTLWNWHLAENLWRILVPRRKLRWDRSLHLRMFFRDLGSWHINVLKNPVCTHHLNALIQNWQNRE